MPRSVSYRPGQPPRVALIFSTSQAYGRALLRGMAQYLRQREEGTWTVYLEHRSLHDVAPPWLADWKGDGIIFHSVEPQLVRTVQKLKLPTVNLNDLSDDDCKLDWPSLRSDNLAIGRLAAQHLLEKGLRHFAFFGYGKKSWSNRRLEGFQLGLREAGYDCRTFVQTQRISWRFWLRSWQDELDALTRWLAELSRPMGVFAANDMRGLQVINAARQAGLEVPRDVAVIGVDNEEIACELSRPELSSVAPDTWRIGYEAADLLDRMMLGETGPREPLFFPPRGIVPRQSTEVTLDSDPRLAAAMDFIRQQACENIGVDDVVEKADISRSLLQQLFRQSLGRTIHDVIIDERLARVKHLLETSDLSLATIARRTGFAYVQYLSAVFKQRTGVSPSEYRRNSNEQERIIAQKSDSSSGFHI